MDRFVVSKDLAQKLKDAGYPQKTEFYWHKHWSNKIWTLEAKSLTDCGESLATPLSDELLEQIPKEIAGKRYLHYSTGWKRGEPSVLWSYRTNDPYISAEEMGEFLDCSADTSANSLALLWLWCKANGHLDRPDKEDR